VTERHEKAEPVRVTDKRHSQHEPVEAAEAGVDPASAPSTDELAEARSRAAEYLEHLQRLQAEFENFRKRTLREQTRAIEVGSEGLVRKLLDTLDDFQLALGSAKAGDRPELEGFLRGFELVHAKLLDALRAEGLQPIEALDAPFDPEEHEALMGSHDAEGEPFVADVLRPGYKLNGRVIRAAGVRVGHRPRAGE
jgi:molecular chaperone GrpE